MSSQTGLTARIRQLEAENRELRETCANDRAAHQELVARLSLSEERFSKAFHASPDSINLNRLSDGAYLAVNHGFTHLTGWTEDEVVGRTSLEIDIWVDPSARAQLLQGLRESGTVDGLTARFRLRDGRTKTGRMSARVIDVQGEPCILSITRDVSAETALMETARTREEQLRQSEERLQQAIRVAQIAFYDHDHSQETIYWSPRQREIYGWGPEEPVTLPSFLECLHPEDRERIGEAVRKAHDPSSDGVYEVEHRIVRRDGEVRWIATRGQTFFEGEGPARHPTRSIGAAFDITARVLADEERSRLQAQLEHSQRLESVGRLAGGVAHDFNNMLHVIRGFAALLRRRLSEDSRSQGYIDRIDSAARTAQDVTGQLLAFSRRQLISPVASDLNALLQKTMSAVSRLIGEDIDLCLAAEEGIWTVNVDPGQIDQILLNLAINARDAMPRGGKLTIETANVRLDEPYSRQHPGSKSGEFVLLAVSDNGIGMDEKTQSHIFEPFFTTKERGKGTGLGLATVYGIVRQNGGFIAVYSEPSRGTTFKVYLPRAAGAAAPEAPPREMTAESVGGTVLVVEDDDSARRLTVELVEALGYTALSAAGPTEALTLCENEQTVVDLLLTDVVMPGMTGRQLAARLARLRPAMKVLFTSGYTSDVIAHHGILEAGVEFLAKPFGLTELGRKLRDLLSAK